MTKYNAVPEFVDKIRFASGMEADRYRELKILEAAGKITGLKVHQRWPLTCNDVVVCHYESDFEYGKDGEYIIEDVKGVKTQMYRLKKKMFEIEHGPYKITEITKGRKSRTLRRAKP